MAKPLLVGIQHPTDGPSPRPLLALARSLEARDPPTRGHAQRVATYAYGLARWLGWEEEVARQLELAGLVHDIGKLIVPAAILTKPGPLDAGERAVVARHPGEGEALVRPLIAALPVLQTVRSHHERWDGGGYPDGLGGTDIPFWARMLAIADSYDALTSDRAYRRGLPRDRALDVLRAGAGSQWDPALVDAFVSMADRWLRPITPAEWTRTLMAVDTPLILPPLAPGR